MIPSRAPWRSSPLSNAVRNCCSASVARENMVWSSSMRRRWEPLPLASRMDCSIWSTSTISSDATAAGERARRAKRRSPRRCAPAGSGPRDKTTIAISSRAELADQAGEKIDLLQSLGGVGDAARRLRPGCPAASFSYIGGVGGAGGGAMGICCAAVDVIRNLGGYRSNLGGISALPEKHRQQRERSACLCSSEILLEAGAAFTSIAPCGIGLPLRS